MKGRLPIYGWCVLLNQLGSIDRRTEDSTNCQDVQPSTWSILLFSNAKIDSDRNNIKFHSSRDFIGRKRNVENARAESSKNHPKITLSWNYVATLSKELNMKVYRRLAVHQSETESSLYTCTSLQQCKSILFCFDLMQWHMHALAPCDAPRIV